MRLPEIDLALGFGEGEMNIDAVAQVLQGWIAGRQVHELANIFPGDDVPTKRRKAAHYIYGTVSQTISWGTHAYLRGWLIGGRRQAELPPEDRMLPAYVQYGVRTPEAAVASLFGIPRPFAEAMGEQYRQGAGHLTPENAGAFREYVEGANNDIWQRVVETANVQGVRPQDIRTVFRQMQGLA